MPSRTFSGIGDQLDDFFDVDEYSYNQGIEVNVKTDVDVNWSLSTELAGSKSRCDSDFEFTKKIGRDKISVVTKSNKDPKFAVKTSRIKGVNASFTLEEPALKFGLASIRERFAVDFKGTYNYSAAKLKSELNFAYEQGDKLTLGAELKLQKEKPSASIEISDYNARVEFRRNPEQTFSFRTDNKAQKIQLGAVLALPRGFTGYFQAGRVMEDYKSDQNDDYMVAKGIFAAGVSYPFDAQNEIRGLFRSDRSATLAYQTRSQSAFAAYFAYNRSVSGGNVNRSLDYKLVFG